MLPNPAADGEKVCARLDQRAGVGGGDAADRDAGYLEQARPPGKDGRVRPVRRLLRRRREEGAEGDIIGPRLPRRHRQMAAVVAGDPDLGGGAEQGARLARVAVLLAEMHPVGAEPLGQRHVVVDDEGDLMRFADPLQRLGEARRLMPVDLLDPELEGRDRPAGESRL